MPKMTALMFMMSVITTGAALAGRAGDDAHTRRAGGDTVTTQGGSGSANAVKPRIRLSAKNVQAIATIDDTPAGKEFLTSLPLTLTLKDHGRTEKIAYLPRKLSTAGAPAGIDPSVGDFAYYAPWGNLAIFYKDFGYSDGLVALGRIESGLDGLARLEDDARVRIEKVER